MAWKDNAVGIVVDKTMDVNFSGLREAGFSFVVVEAGLGFDPSPVLPEHLSKADAAGLPVIAQWTPHPAYDDYTFDGIAQEQIIAAKKALANKVYNAFVTSIERWWTGFDVEEGHNPIRKATPTAIDHVASEFSHSFTKLLAPLGCPVLVRSNDNFVQTYSPPMGMGWTDKFGFFLADWRYRTRAADGSWSVYTIFPAHTFTNMAAFRSAMPPDNSKNPLIPGSAPQLKFWEFTGSLTMPTNLVKGWDGAVKKVKAVLFNSDEAACYGYLKYSAAAPPPDDPDDPGDPSDTGSQQLDRIIELLEGIGDDISAILGVFQKIFR